MSWPWLSWQRSWSTSQWDAGITWFSDVLEAPTEDPVPLEYVRDHHLRSPNGTAEDDRIRRAIKAATSQAEHYMQRAIVPQTRVLVMDGFPSAEILIPFPPLIEVVSVVYVDGDGAEQTVDAASYQVSRQSGPKARRSRIRLASGQSWPSTASQQDAVTITYRAGYVTGGSPEVANVPEDLQESIAMRAAEFYKQRSDSVIDATVESAMVTSRHIWADYKVY